MKYLVKKVCKNCGHEDSFPVSKKEAAFELYNYSKNPCSVCASKHWASMTHPKPDVDQELLDMWGNDAGLFFCIQDEEFILSEGRYHKLLLNAIDHSTYLKSKIDILLYSLCCLVYDNTVGEEEYTDMENQKRKKIRNYMCAELRKRKERLADAEDHMWDYVKEVVFPLVGLP